MACANGEAAAIREAAFRSRCSGAVVRTGAFHDVGLLPRGDDADLEEWQAGFTDERGRFLTRREAAEAVGARGRLEAVSFFAGDPEPTLEAGHPESWRCGRAASLPAPPGPAPRRDV